MAKTPQLKIFSIKVLPLYGASESFENLRAAMIFVKKQDELGAKSKPLIKMEVTIRYTDGSIIEAGFPHKYRALEFLQNRKEGLL